MKIVFIALVTLGCVNALAGSGFDSVSFRSGDLVHCLGGISDPHLLQITVRKVDADYQARFQFLDGHVEIFPAVEVFIPEGRIYRLISGRPSLASERVDSFDIMSPRLDIDYGGVKIKSEGRILMAQVSCAKT